MRPSIRLGVVGLLAFVGGCTLLTNLDDLTSTEAFDGGADALAADAADAASLDGAAPDGQSADAPQPTTCRWDATFGGPRLLLDSPTESVAAPQLSPDELVMYFQATSGGSIDLYRVKRSDRSQPFGDRVPITELNIANVKDSNIAVRADGLLALFSSDRADAGTPELYAAKRATIAAPFDPPKLITTLGPTAPKATSFITKDGSELWFSVTDGVSRATYLSPITAVGFGQATPRTDVAGWFPVLSDDKLTIYFAAGQSSIENSVRVAHRAGVLDPFPASSLVNELNQSGDTPSWLSPDQCRLYMTTQRNGRAQIYLAERLP